MGSIIMFSNSMQLTDEKAPAFSQLILVLEDSVSSGKGSSLMVDHGDDLQVSS